MRPGDRARAADRLALLCKAQAHAGAALAELNRTGDMTIRPDEGLERLCRAQGAVVCLLAEEAVQVAAALTEGPEDAGKPQAEEFGYGRL